MSRRIEIERLGRASATVRACLEKWRLLDPNSHFNSVGMSPVSYQSALEDMVIALVAQNEELFDAAMHFHRHQQPPLLLHVSTAGKTDTPEGR